MRAVTNLCRAAWKTTASASGGTTVEAAPALATHRTGMEAAGGTQIACRGTAPTKSAATWRAADRASLAAQPGRLAVCTPVPAGIPDPRGVCFDSGASSCGQDGTCDGQGGCHLYDAGVICDPTSSCSGTLWSAPGTCNDTGICKRQMIPCLPYACDPQTNNCHASCTTAADCAPGTACTNGACGIFQRAACSVGSECVSGFCAQGVCCSTNCDGTCFSCALPGTTGTCTRVPNPPDAGACGAGPGY